MKQKKLYITSIAAVIFAVFLQFSTALSLSAEHLDATAYFIRLINDTRKAPENVLSETGLDKQQAQANLGTQAWVLDQGLAPVAWNSKLYASALSHANDMINNLYYAYNSQNGDTPKKRITSAGYNYMYAGESLGILSFEKYIEPKTAAKLIFENMLAYELGDSINASDRNILNQNMTETGIAFVSVVADLGLDVPVNIYLVVADFGRPLQSRNFIIGNTSQKTSATYLFDPVNALAGENIILKKLSEQKQKNTVSNIMGFFQFEMPFGFFVLELADENGNVLDTIKYFGQDKNLLFDLFADN